MDNYTLAERAAHHLHTPYESRDIYEKATRRAIDQI